MLGYALGQGGSGLDRVGTLIHGLPRHRLLTPMHAHRGVEGLLDGHTFARQAGQRMADDRARLLRRLSGVP